MTDPNELLESALEHHRNGRFHEAGIAYQDILAADPDHPDGLYLYGCLAQQTENYAAACELLRKAVAVAPSQAEYHYALGLALSAVNEFEAAVHTYERAVELAPKHAAALAELGRTLRASDPKNTAAVEYLHRAFTLAPEDIAVGCDLADALLNLGGASQAIAIYQHLVHLKPQSSKVWYGYGCAENMREEYGAARNCFAHAAELEPDWLEARHNLGRALYEVGQVNQSFAQFQRCSEMERQGSEHSRAMMAVIVPGVSTVDNAGVLETRKAWADRDLRPALASTKLATCRTPLRVGYVSSFFQRDNWMKPVWGLLNQHDRTAIQVCLFSDCTALEIQHGYRAQPQDLFFDTSKMSNGEIADLIERSQIDVLVDLNGYSNMRRLPLFARRLAQVMIAWFNMYATTGMSSFDYLIGDHCVVRPEEERFYSEKLLRVHGSYLTFEVSYPVPEIAERACREKRGFVFGALVSQYKITDEVIASWCRILQASPSSLLLVKNRQMGKPSGRESLIARFGAHGIGTDRLRLEAPEEHFEFLKAYGRVDVALDTFPYNGGTTTTESLWQGVPVVTFYGDRWASRTSASLLRAAGLEEFVAADIDGYVDLAAQLANDEQAWKRLSVLRRDMRTKLTASSVCDTTRFARQIEAAYQSCCQSSR